MTAVCAENVSVPREASAVVHKVPIRIFMIGVATPAAVFTTLNIHLYIVFAFSAVAGTGILEPTRYVSVANPV